MRPPVSNSISLESSPFNSSRNVLSHNAAMLTSGSIRVFPSTHSMPLFSILASVNFLIGYKWLSFVGSIRFLMAPGASRDEGY